jgi:hypothetical protein
MFRTFLMVLLLVGAGALYASDVLETKSGDTFVGKFEKLEAGVVHFRTDSAGLVRIPAERVTSISLEGERDAKVRRGEDLKSTEDAVIYTEDGVLLYRVGNTVTTTTALTDLRGVNETVPDKRPQWTVSAMGSASWTEGNNKTVAFGYRFDITRTTRRNFQTLFARGSYLQDRELERDSVRERKHHLGYLYRYTFDFNLTIDLTQDVYWNSFAGYRWRSVTGFGPGYYFIREDKFKVHGAAHLTYTYEDQIAGAPDRDYLGARLRGELDWVGVQDTVHVNLRSELLFDFSESKNLRWNSALMVNYRLSSYITTGLLVEHEWRNMPPRGFKKSDFRITYTIGVSWSGRGI